MGGLSLAPSRPMQAMPVTIVSGFLGAGKTTLLNHLLTHAEGARIGVLVNDFGELNIDSQLIVAADADRIELSNGCICCSVRDDLVAALSRLMTSRPDLDRIVIETSGVSHPVGVMETLFQPAFAGCFDIESVICVVDAANYPDLSFEDGELALAQMAVADFIALNKCDLASPEALRQLRTDLSEASPRARLIETVRGALPSILLERPDTASRRRVCEAAADHGFRAIAWQSPERLSLARFRALVRDLPASVYRAKGLLRLVGTDGRRAVFHLVGKRAVIDGWHDGCGASELVFIAREGGVDGEALRAALDACAETSDAGHPAGDAGISDQNRPEEGIERCDEVFVRGVFAR